jgi:ATP-dependent Lon protease
MTSDFRGDPSSALLEVLDPEQNCRFRDHYIEAPYDLSKVLFITTANGTDAIDRALLDRMEIIEVPSYSLEEKAKIARSYLIPKQMKAHGLAKEQLRIGAPALKAVIDQYTRESGVRTLERTLARLCRKAALELLENPGQRAVNIRLDDLKRYLGAARFLRQDIENAPQVGVVNGLAWTSVGGEVMPIETLTLPGKGNIEITGQLGDVMRESAKLAISIVRTHMGRYGVEEDFFAKHDIHIHVPEGAVPKDGPSAGITLTTALASLLAGVPVPPDTAMTGEVSLQGDIGPIGGLPEKLMAAQRGGVKRVFIPKDNTGDLKDVAEEVKRSLTITPVSTVEEVLTALDIPVRWAAPVPA